LFGLLSSPKDSKKYETKKRIYEGSGNTETPLKVIANIPLINIIAAIMPQETVAVDLFLMLPKTISKKRANKAALPHIKVIIGNRSSRAV